MQHFIHHLAPHGVAGFVLANGSLSSQQSGEGEIRKAIVEADLVDCIVSLPGQLFFTTQIPVCLWFLARDKSNGLALDKRLRDRRRETLFIDARRLGTMETRTLKVLTDADIGKISGVYHAWRETGGGYADEPGFCRAATTEDIAAQSYVLTPGRYVGPRRPKRTRSRSTTKIKRLDCDAARADGGGGEAGREDPEGAWRGRLWVVSGAKRLGNVSVNHDARRVPVKEADRTVGQFPYYGASGVVDFVDDFLFDGEYLLVAEDGENLRTRQTAVAFMACGKFWVNNHAHILQGSNEALTRFLHYALAAADISPYLTGAVMPKLTQANLNRSQSCCRRSGSKDLS